jgi:hypothetical protein
MNLQQTDDDILRALRRLPVVAPDVARIERVRLRCHAAMLERRERTERRRRRQHMAVHVVEVALVGGLSAGYLAAILFVLLGLH